MIDKSRVCFVRAKALDDYYFDGIIKSGYRAIIPYRDYNILFRFLREVWFRLRLPCRKIWYNPAIKNTYAELYIVSDMLIVPGFLEWIKEKHPDSRVALRYENRVNRTFNPNYIVDKSIEKWSYDDDDCIEYEMSNTGQSYLDVYADNTRNKNMEYDVVFLGCDKGRASLLLEYEQYFKNLGLKTYIHICADRSFKRYSKPFYKPPMRYVDYISLINRSHAILNIVPVGQKSLTMREYEAVFNCVKCITNNRGVKNFFLYHPSRYFILDDDKLEDLSQFLNEPFLPVDSDSLDKLSFDGMVSRIFNKEIY